MQMSLEVFVCRETQSLDYANRSCRIGAQAAGKCTYTKQHKGTRILQNRTNYLLTLRTKVL